jgi:hypothetical protein
LVFVAGCTPAIPGAGGRESIFRLFLRNCLLNNQKNGRIQWLEVFDIKQSLPPTTTIDKKERLFFLPSL